jgi:uncharacterized cupredoxin-like copper-binding protein
MLAHLGFTGKNGLSREIAVREGTQMKFVRLLAALGLALAILSMALPGVSAQEATPEGTPAADCVAPALPVASPADPVASPVGDGTEMDVEDAAPVSEGPASRNIGATAEEALANFVNCVAAGNWEGVAALLTPNMVMYIAGSANPQDVVTSFEEGPPAPIELIDVRDPVIDTNNRIGLSLVYSGLYSGPGIQTAEKWYFVRDGDTLKLDETVTTSLPVDLYPEVPIVTVQMVDYAFALDMNTIPAGPVVFRFSNTSFNGEPHVGVTVTLTEGMTAEQIIQGEALPEDQMTGFVNAIFLEPGQTGDYYVEDLAPGTYTLVCDVTTPDGTPHWMLGMVAQFTVE